MQTFGDILNELKTKTKAELSDIVQSYADKAAQEIGKYMNGNTKLASYTVFSTIIGTVISDGYFSEEEYEVAKPVIDMIMEEDVSYEDVAEGIKIANLDISNFNAAVDLIAEAGDKELNYALFVLCAALCVADNDLKMEELAWLNKFAG